MNKSNSRIFLCAIFTAMNLWQPAIAEVAEQSQDSLLNILKKEDISYFEKKWDQSDEAARQLILKDQWQSFHSLYSKTSETADNLEELVLLAKISRITPISSPYQKRILDFIAAQDIKKRRLLLEAVEPYLLDFSAEEIRTTQTIDGKVYVNYAWKSLECFFLIECIQLQIAFAEGEKPLLLLKKVDNLLEKIEKLGPEITNINVQINEENISFLLQLRHPLTTVVFGERNISINVDKSPEQI